MNQTPEQLPELDYRYLDRQLDITKTMVFLGKNASFLGPLMASMNFHWEASMPTACTNGVYVKWNPYFFFRLKPPARKFVLLHELWHPGFLHMIRCGNRDPEVWNWAGDIVINNMLDTENDGTYSMEAMDLGFEVWRDHAYDGWTTEAVYDDLYEQKEELTEKAKQCAWGDLIQEADGATQKAIAHQVLNNVVSAVHSSVLGGGAGNLPGEIQVTLNKFLSPKLPWDTILREFFNELKNQDYSWKRPNRRFTEMYLPSLVDDDGGLDHVAYFLDVSGSITDDHIVRFHSEFKYVKETFEPEKMTMLQFDTRITKIDVFEKDDPFEETHIIGRGGTSLDPARTWIIENKPTAVVIFSDLQCAPMEPLPPDANVPIIWIALNARGAQVNMGTLVYLNE